MAYTTELLCFSYTCSALSDDLQERLKYSNKILLPPSVLYDINQLEKAEYPLFFKIKNKETEFGKVCGLHEFTAPPGVCHIPYYLLAELGMKEGEEIVIELATPVKGTSVKLRPHTTDFINLNNPKVILEKVMSLDYPVITEGHTIAINYKDLNRVFYIDVIETKPTSVIQIINTDINLEFDTPLDYVEPELEPEVSPPSPPESPKQASSNQAWGVNTVINSSNDASSKLDDYRINDKGFVPFSGKGHRLGDS